MHSCNCNYCWLALQFCNSHSSQSWKSMSETQLTMLFLSWIRPTFNCETTVKRDLRVSKKEIWFANFIQVFSPTFIYDFDSAFHLSVVRKYIISKGQKKEHRESLCFASSSGTEPVSSSINANIYMPAIAYLNWVPVHNKAQVRSWQAHIKRKSLRHFRCLKLQIKMSIAYLCSKYELRLYSCLSRLIVIHWVILPSLYCNFTCKSMMGPSSKLLAVQNLCFNSNLKLKLRSSIVCMVR